MGTRKDAVIDRNQPHSAKRAYWTEVTTRKPLLLLRFDTVLLLRFAERKLFGLLFQEPPRNTRRPLGLFLWQRGLAVLLPATHLLTQVYQQLTAIGILLLCDGLQLKG